ncbi:MAG: SOS response-associated peptidase, partial [Desulfovibrio sp.]|nr:SOS response-associated peptidase [Desulfovibrio sp.]
MCGRFDIDLSNRDIDRYVSQLPCGSPPPKQGEIFPGNNALTLIMRDGAVSPESMSWGFPRRDGKGVVFNARAETALQKPMFRQALIHYPAVIPA